MPVYVDMPFEGGKRVGRFGPETLWCHMFADTLDELHDMAAKIGMRRSWFQDKPGFPHYDLTGNRRARALACGAIELKTRREFVEKLKEVQARSRANEPERSTSEEK